MRERRVARARITLVSTALFAAAFAGLAVLLVTNVRGSLERHARSATRDAVDDLTSGLRRGVDPEQIVSQSGFRIQPGIDFVILDSNGRVIAGTLAPAFVIGTAPEPLPGQIVETRITRLGDVEYTVAAANPLDDIRNTRRISAVYLRGEKVDLVPYDEDPARFVCNAIAPAEVARVIIDGGAHTMQLVVPDEKLSLAVPHEDARPKVGAPVPVPPPMPAAMNSMWAPESVERISSIASSAAASPISGLEPAPSPSVKFAPSWMRCSPCFSVAPADAFSPSTWPARSRGGRRKPGGKFTSPTSSGIPCFPPCSTAFRRAIR